ncbi:MAG: hypothetical protein D3914_02480 [Candidatus Electrothrix sp. LOE2]|nr:hypothetical protein [Candidatus Electrothrix sp. LOE2]
MTDSGSTFQEEFFKKHDYYKVIILLLQKGEAVEIMLTGHCMKPLLREKDLIAIKPIQAEQLRCGDVAIYHVNGRLKAHRFLRFITLDGKSHLQTKSDRRHRYDPPVPAANFLGIICKVTRNNRTINYETGTWQTINSLLGKLSPFISVIERPIVFLLRLPKRAARKLYRTVLT